VRLAPAYQTGKEKEQQTVRITEVSAVVRYSAEAKGAWRSIEVGATATLTNSDESWEQAQTELYHRLGQQLKALWNNGTSKAETQEKPSNSPDSPATTRQHFCQEHQQEYKPKEGKYGTFYSHKAPDGSWCNESNK
jgi:hypothetical protein